MQDWLNFFIFLFLVSIPPFYLGSLNFISILFLAEILWIILYSLSIYLGSLLDDLSIVTFSFFLLGFAGLEYCLGFLLLVLFKELNVSFLFSLSTDKHHLPLYK